MDYNEVIPYVNLAIASTTLVTVPHLTYMLVDSVKKGLSARGALKLVALGDDYRNHRWTIDDARSDGIWIAWAIAGGKKALERVVLEERKIAESIGPIRNN